MAEILAYFSMFSLIQSISSIIFLITDNKMFAKNNDDDIDDYNDWQLRHDFSGKAILFMNDKNGYLTKFFEILINMLKQK